MILTLLFDFLPINDTGMSIITAIVLFFAGIGASIYFYWDRREHARLMSYTNNCINFVSKDVNETNKKVDILFTKNDEINRDLSFIKSHVAGIHESVGWIKEFIKEKR